MGGCCVRFGVVGAGVEMQKGKRNGSLWVKGCERSAGVVLVAGPSAAPFAKARMAPLRMTEYGWQEGEREEAGSSAALGMTERKASATARAAAGPRGMTTREATARANADPLRG